MDEDSHSLNIGRMSERLLPRQNSYMSAHPCLTLGFPASVIQQIMVQASHYHGIPWPFAKSTGFGLRGEQSFGFDPSKEEHSLAIHHSVHQSMGNKEHE